MAQAATPVGPARACRHPGRRRQQELTDKERAALKRHEKDKEERLRWQYYAAIPQKHWRQMSGRQTKVINEQALRYSLPFGGPHINLPAVVRAFHDFLADRCGAPNWSRWKVRTTITDYCAMK